WAALLALGELDAPEAHREMAALLRDSEEEIRVAAAEALGKCDALESVHVLLALSGERDRDDSERLNLLEPLVRMRVKDAAEGLKSFLKSDAPHVRWRAVDGLGKLGACDAASKIVVLLREDAEVQL